MVYDFHRNYTLWCILSCGPVCSIFEISISVHSVSIQASVPRRLELSQDVAAE